MAAAHRTRYLERLKRIDGVFAKARDALLRVELEPSKTVWLAVYVDELQAIVFEHERRVDAITLGILTRDCIVSRLSAFILMLHSVGLVDVFT